ncbi:DUF4838 domain-containing protein [Microlunatus sp. Y2014]|uniref:DUF4838 domain-containing protein n=1 Tax=Microlunatus sp. Y2014 TaxID=3418488 RepID=UPI003DA78D6C
MDASREYHVPVTRGGRPVAHVTVAPDADGTTRKAATLLVDTIRAATGVTLEVRAATTAAPPDVPRIQVGAQPGFLASGGLAALQHLPVDGFVLQPGPTGLTLAGPTPIGTEFAVVEFCERFVGASWLLPGPDGVDIPRRRGDLTVRLARETHRPVTHSRMIMAATSPTGLGGPEYYTWGRRNRLRGEIEFRHAMWSLLPPTRYAAQHPEWYPPHADLTLRYGWQPRFTDPGTVSAAVDDILQHFTESPRAESVSLAVNDYSGFHPADVTAGRRNSAGFPDASQAYYTWVNQVAERVAAHHPDKKFGVLAYHDVLDPPDFELHPSVVPFITGDRITWSVPEIGVPGRRLTESWSMRATELGWWEYLHGAGYMVPKVAFDQLAANYRFAADHGVVHHFAESWPDWGGGPQLWLAMRLMWDPTLDPTTLLEHWCDRVAGAEGGPALVAYYRHWEEFWTTRIPRTRWLARWRDAAVRSDYLRFDEPDYLDEVTERDEAVSRGRLESAAAGTGTRPQRNRVALLQGKWRYYAAAIAYHQMLASWTPPRTPTTDDEATALLTAMVSRHRAGEAVLARLHDITPAVAIRAAAHLPTVLERAGLNATFGPGAVAALLAWFRAADRQRTHTTAALEALAAPGEPDDTVGWLARLIRLIALERDGLLVNPVFHDGLTGWEVNQPRTGLLELGSDGRSVVATGVSDGGLGQRVALAPGRYGLLLEFSCPADTTRGTFRFLVQHHDRAGVAHSRPERSPWTRVGPTAGRGATAECLFDVPSGIDGAPVDTTRIDLEFTTVIEGPGLPSMDPTGQVTLTAFHLHRLDGAGMPTATVVVEPT